MKTYTVLAARNQIDVLDGKCDVEYTGNQAYDTIKEAKARAKHLLTDEYQALAEASEPLRYSQVIDDSTGDCLYDFFRKGYRGFRRNDETGELTEF